MDSKAQFCPNAECPTVGRVGQGNIVIHSPKEARYRCKDCGKTFSETKGTAFYRLRTDANLVSCMISLMQHGCPPQAIVATYGFDERTVYNWFARGGSHTQEVHKDLVEKNNIDVNHLQVDELCVNKVREHEEQELQQGDAPIPEQIEGKVVPPQTNGDAPIPEQIEGEVVPPQTSEPSLTEITNHVWIAMAMDVESRLWLGGAVSEHRDKSLIMNLAQHVRNCLKNWFFLVCSDGLSTYASVFASVFSWLVFTGHPGRPKRHTVPGLMIAQVVKEYSKGHVVSVIRRVVRGTVEAVNAMLEKTGSTVINTSYIERLNATFRGHLAALARKGRAIVHTEARLEQGMYLVGCSYNFCYFHESLRILAPAGTSRKWIERTPAMVAGLTDHKWTMLELMNHKIRPKITT